MEEGSNEAAPHLLVSSHQINPPPPFFPDRRQPPIGLSTPAVFKALDLDKLSKEDPRALLDAFTSRMGKGQAVPPEFFVNDLEPPAFQCIPDLKRIKDRLLVRAFALALALALVWLPPPVHLPRLYMCLHHLAGRLLSSRNNPSTPLHTHLRT